MEDCTHPFTVVDEREGCDVCVHCGAVVCSGLTRPVEWTSSDDCRQRGSVPHAGDAWPEGDMHSNVGIQSLQRFQMGLVNKNKVRVFAQGRDYIVDVCTYLNVGSAVQKEALDMFAMLKGYHLKWRGARRIGVLLACISLTCQKLSVGVTDRDILSCPRVMQPTKVMNSQKKMVLMILHEQCNVRIRNASASSYCTRICNDMGFTPELTQMVSKKAERISLMEHMNARSCGMIVAVSIIYIVDRHGLLVDINQLCRVTQVTRPTVVKWYAEATQKKLADTRAIINNLDSRLAR